jgi:Flp pilus assembly protein TadD
MKALCPPHTHLVNAAVGWLELGLTVEARRELEQLPAELRSHPEVLEVRWSLSARENNWEAALAVAERLVRDVPDRCSGWIQRSYSLHELKRTTEAREQLLPAAARFPDVSTIPYNLACYDCQLGRLDKARSWLNVAMRLGSRESILNSALCDPDLKPLWSELKEPGRS